MTPEGLLAAFERHARATGYPILLNSSVAGSSMRVGSDRRVHTSQDCDEQQCG